MNDLVDAAPRVRVRLRHFSRSLPMLLLRAREGVMRHFRTKLRRYGITEQQWRILRALANGSRLEVTELARVTFLLGPSLSRILKDLEARGLIERHADPADLRRAHIGISALGTALIERVSPDSEVIYGAITDAFGAERMADLQRLLEELEEVMQSLEVTLPHDTVSSLEDM
ncbi:homoprotocatechuate degradation operon regulator HpaR [Rhodopila sp.]|jgi:homoprotocatechuate degradation regulator HpaR|uniref:homoprotocatechuate degradation operon regulator HpaR n=1 Tax=Rhodopila sp. TaxID=2480087 RepID=UPI002B88A3DD|nr:homoprotocatechuate degradation operon regulator HpaR [Rhodopila sp.]HVZ08546.1 homoprotocatechuate degradation operon regulator HpaR [Rhodopila sp.]